MQTCTSQREKYNCFKHDYIHVLVVDTLPVQASTKTTLAITVRDFLSYSAYVDVQGLLLLLRGSHGQPVMQAL